MSSSLALRPIESDLVAVLRGATSQRGLTQEIAAEAVRRGITRVVFTGVGGSWASGVPANVLLGSLPTPFSSENINATELTSLYLPSIDEKTLVIAASHSGGTPETVAAAEAAAARGAFVVSLARDADNALGRAAAFHLTYGSDRTITSAKYVLLTELSYSLLEAFDAGADSAGAAIAGARAALDAIPEATLAALEAYDSKLSSIAAAYSPSDNLYVLGAGPMVGLAYMLSVCYLVEMQWKKSTYFTAADFFHGPFEMAQNDQPFILIAGADGTRGHIDRVRTFLDRYNDTYEVIDVDELQLEGIAPEQRGAVGHIPMASVVMRLADHFEAASGHDLDSRLYMHKVEY
jgi:fructoselysine-6-P-deglycase FrlB-like protein